MPAMRICLNSETEGTEVTKTSYDIGRAIWKFLLGIVPTCDLQWELSRRPGVETFQLQPYEDKTIKASGPATLSINRD